MPQIQFQIPPGIYHSGTARMAAGRWYAGNLVRWLSGVLRPIYGWVAHTASPVTGAARALITWKDNSNNSWIGIGTDSNLYVMDRGGDLFDITPSGFTTGRPDGTYGTGYSGGLYGAGTYGTPRPDTNNILDATVLSLDTWGQNLVAISPDDGKVYQWVAPTTGTKAQIITPAAGSTVPTGTALVVTAERFLMVLATTDPRTVQWCDQQNLTLWLPDATNQAGQFPLQTFGRLMCGKRLVGATGLWTDTDMWVASYVGGTFVYGFQQAGTGCGVISRGAVAAANGQCAWMGPNGFWTYNGYVQPLACDVQDYVFGDLNRAQISKVTAVLNSQYGEVWWFYPSAASNEIDRAVSWSFRDNIWMLHTLARTCGADISGAFQVPLLLNPADSLVYEHETGFGYAGAQPFAQTGPLEFAPLQVTYTGQGATVWQATRFTPDELLEGDVQATFTSSIYPNGPATVSGPYTMTPKTDVRFSGKQVQMTITGVRNDDWRFGNGRLDVQGHGDR